MNCVRCGNPTSADQTVCERCKELGGIVDKTAPNSIAASATPEPISAVPISATPSVSVWTAIRIFLAAAVAFLLAFVTYGVTVSAEFVGYWIGSMLLPFGIAYLIAGRRSKRDWSRFSWIFLALGTLLPAIAYSGNTRHSTLKPEAVAVESLRVATGAKKAEFSGTSAEQETQRLSNIVVTKMLSYRKEHDAKVASVSVDLEQLYTAKSFSSRQEISRSLGAIDTALDADEELDRSIDHWRDDVKEDVDRSSLSGSDKQDFVKGVDEGLNGSEILPLRKQATSAEKDWAAASRDLYEFALANRQHIMVNQAKLAIDNENIRLDFNAKLKHSLELRDQLRSFNKQIAEKRADIAKRIGVKPEELEIKN